ncbi:MAG: DUF2971 domain-containing protein [Chloroflexi bacterium]|nr:DUF2971 domain-containing protein [Chloroflexota bacterium]
MYVSPKPIGYLPGDAVLWRYMSFAKFVAILHTRTLFFPSLANLQDSFEGSFPDANVDLVADILQYEEDTPEDRASALKDFLDLNRKNRRSFVVNCWFQGETESFAMWKLYAGGGEGIAIKSNVSSLINCFKGGQPVFISPVQYIDYKSDIIDDLAFFTRALVKRKGYEHEAEVRAYYSHIPMKDGEVDKSPESYERPGVSRQIDVDVLIKEVIVTPEAGSWFLELVKMVAAHYGLKAPVRLSSLADTPNWDRVVL